MTPVPLELPLRPAEAAAVANLIFDHAERKPLNDELRARIAARSSVLRLSGLTLYFGSLERDPVHPSTYYLAVDGAAGEPLLLHMALANAPTSSLFAKPLLVGRMPRPSGPEMVLNCLPFGPGDGENVVKFASHTDTRLLPRPAGPRPTVVVEAVCPEVDFPIAFDTFRVLLKRTGKNTAAFAGGPAAFSAAVWAAIRAGWREGYSMGTAIPPGPPEETREVIRRAAGCSRFVVSAGGSIETAGAIYEWIRQARRSFDCELSFDDAPAPTTAAELETCLQWMKERGKAVQLAAPRLDAEAAGLAELAEVARQHGCMLSLPWLSNTARTGLGRLSYRIAAGSSDLAAVVQQAAAGLLA